MFLNNADLDALARGCAVELECVGSGGVIPRQVSTTGHKNTISNHCSKEKLQLFFHCRVLFEQLRELPALSVVVHCDKFSDTSDLIITNSGDMLGKRRSGRVTSPERGASKGLLKKKRRKDKSLSLHGIRRDACIERAITVFVHRVWERIASLCYRCNNKIKCFDALQKIFFSLMRQSGNEPVSTFSRLFRSLNGLYEESIPLCTLDAVVRRTGVV